MHHYQEEYPEDNVADSGDTAAESSYCQMNEFQSLYEESQSQIEELRKENTKLKAEYVPIISYCDFDMNDYREHPCIYLIHIHENDYKFGETGEIDKRYYAHMNDFTKRGCKPKLIKVWKCRSMQIMKNTEKQIKIFATQNNIKVEKYDKTEIITTDNIQPVIDVICKYIEYGNKKDEDFQKVYLAELELENNRVKLEIIKHAHIEVELRKLDIEHARLKLEILHVEKNITSVANLSEIPQIDIMPTVINNCENIKIVDLSVEKNEQQKLLDQINGTIQEVFKTCEDYDNDDQIVKFIIDMNDRLYNLSNDDKLLLIHEYDVLVNTIDDKRIDEAILWLSTRHSKYRHPRIYHIEYSKDIKNTLSCNLFYLVIRDAVIKNYKLVKPFLTSIYQSNYKYCYSIPIINVLKPINDAIIAATFDEQLSFAINYMNLLDDNNIVTKNTRAWMINNGPFNRFKSLTDYYKKYCVKNKTPVEYQKFLMILRIYLLNDCINNVK